MNVTLLTPTCDRPQAFALCERYMARQTYPIERCEWIVADGGSEPAPCTMDQVQVYHRRPAGALNFANNLLTGLACAQGDVIIFIEDDDYYAPDHVERMVDVATRAALIGAEEVQTYYNVSVRAWRQFNNVGASLCQTAIRRELVPQFIDMVKRQMAAQRYGIDTNFWRSIPPRRWGMVGRRTVLGIKGVPGLAGLGVGHRPGAGWTADLNLSKLQEWIGADAELYAPFYRSPL